ncbi:MAG: M6 family metalloprotease domain-containing protein [bacterium]|jgi:immune inhibitor A
MKTMLAVFVLGALIALTALQAYAMPLSPKALEKARKEGAPLSDELLAPPPPYVNAPGPIPPLGHSGAYKALVICIAFTDSGYTYSTSSFDNMVFGPWGTGSINDYYTEISYGNLTLSGNTYGWYTASQGRDYYGDNQKGWGAYPKNAAKLVEEAVDAAETAGCNFALYDNDGDGEVESMWIVHSHEGCETSLNSNDIQSHKAKISQMGGTARVYDGVTIDTYMCVPELQSTAPLQHVQIGVYCHEYGHALGLPDLYDVGRYCTGTMGWGIGAWGLMSFGGWGGDVVTPSSPSHMSCWSKIQMGWINPSRVTMSSGTNITLWRAEDYPHAWKVGMDMQHTEYFLVEMRDSAYGFDKSLIKSGVLIYHVDDDQYMENDCENGTGCPSNYHLMVALEQPDNSYDLDCGATGNYGDRGDMYPYGTVDSFDPTTSPSSYTNEGTNTGVYIGNINPASNRLFADMFIMGKPLHPQCVYDDGYYNIMYRWSTNDAGFAVKCTPAKYPCEVRGLRIMIGDAYYPHFQWRIWDDSGSGGTPGSPLTPVHTVNPATVSEWVYCDATGDTVIVDSGSFWAVYIEYNYSQIYTDNDSPWSGRTMTYYLGNFFVDNGAYGNYMIRAVYDTLVCAGVPETPAPDVVALVSPNPFREETALSFALDRTTHVAVIVYDIKGRRIKELARGPFEAGRHSVVWDGTDARGNPVCSGIYFYRFITPVKARTGKVTLLR